MKIVLLTLLSLLGSSAYANNAAPVAYRILSNARDDSANNLTSAKAINATIYAEKMTPLSSLLSHISTNLQNMRDGHRDFQNDIATSQVLTNPNDKQMFFRNADVISNEVYQNS